MFYSDSFSGSRVWRIAIHCALACAWLQNGIADGQVADRNEEALERNRQILQEINVSRLVHVMNMLRPGTGKLVAELDEDQEQKIAELATIVTRTYFQSDAFRKGLSQSGDRVAYRREFGSVIRDDDLELQRSQIEQFRKWQGELENILLPHQLEMLKFSEVRGIAARKYREFGSLGVALGLADELELDEKERASLKEATEKAVEQFRAEAAELNRKAWEEVLAALPEDKRKKMAEIAGDLASEAQFDPNAR